MARRRRACPAGPAARPRGPHRDRDAALVRGAIDHARERGQVLVDRAPPALGEPARLVARAERAYRADRHRAVAPQIQQRQRTGRRGLHHPVVGADPHLGPLLGQRLRQPAAERIPRYCTPRPSACTFGRWWRSRACGSKRATGPKILARSGARAGSGWAWKTRNIHSSGCHRTTCSAPGTASGRTGGRSGVTTPLRTAPARSPAPARGRRGGSAHAPGCSRPGRARA